MTTASGLYDFIPLERVVWGRPTEEMVKEEIERRGSARVFIVTSPSLRRASTVPDTLASDLGENGVGLFDALQPHTPAPQVADLAARLRESGADLVVTLGGGTPIDTVKAALAMLEAGASDPAAVMDRRPSRTLPPIRQIAVPTTLSGAEFSDVGGVTDPETRIKHGVGGRGVGPAAVLIDPELALHTPIDLWTSTGIRAIDHAVETLCSVAPTPYTDALAEATLRMLPDALRQSRADPNDPAARLDAQLAVWTASAGLNRIPFGASHGIGHQLGAAAGVPHGVCSCVLLATVLDWNAEVRAAGQDRVAAALGAPTAAQGVAGLVADLGLPTRLSEAGVRRDQLPKIAESSLRNRWVRSNPRPIHDVRDVMAILERAF